jgi:hypothetical protein
VIPGPLRSCVERHTVLGSALLVLLFAATPAASSARLPSPCELLAPSQVAALLGSKIEGTVTGGTASDPSCTWTGPTDAEGARPDLVLSIHPVRRAVFSSWSGRIPTVRVRGFGHLAYWFLGGHALAAWSNGEAVDLGGGAESYSPRAKAAIAVVLRRV